MPHFPCEAQQACQQWFIKTYGSREGLPDTEKGVLRKDDRGFLWIGGKDGLSRFDGLSFTHFSTLDGLQSNTITDIKPDTTGLMYVSTPRAIHRYTGSRPAFYRYPVPLPAPCHVICPEDSNRIWIGLTGRDTLYCWDQGRLKKMPVKGSVEWIEHDRDGYLYALTDQQWLYIFFDGQIKECICLPKNPAAFRQLYKDEGGKVWYTGTSYVYRLSGWGLADSIPLPFSMDKNIAAGKYIIASNTLLHLQNDCWNSLLTLPVSDSGYAVKGIEKDKAGRYWLLSQHNLLQLYPKKYEQGSWPSPAFHFAQSNTGRTILVRDSSSGLSPLHAKIFERLKPQLTGTYQSYDGTTWYLTRAGLYYLRPGSSKLNAYGTGSENGGPFQFTGAKEDLSGGVWLIEGTGVHYYRDGRFVRYQFPPQEEPLSVSNTALDQQGRLFVAAGKLFVSAQGCFISLPLPAGLPDRPIGGITTDPDKNFWIWMDSSVVYKMKMEKNGRLSLAGSIEVTVNGQPSLPRAIEFDQNGNLWVATRQQMHIFLRLPGGIFSTGHQLVLSGEQRMGELTRDKCLLFPGMRRSMYLQNGQRLYRFDSKEVIQSYYRGAPEVYFSGIEFSYEEDEGRMQRTSIPVAGMIPSFRLPALDHTLTISFGALCPETPENIVYRFRLLGVDDGWQPVTRSQTAIYTGLKPGHYLFLLQAANASGLWSEPLRYDFTIGPAWYSKPVAKIVWLMLGVFLLLALSYYVLQIRAQKKELENMVIDQQLKTLRAQINPHFLQNSFEFLAQHIRLGDQERSITIIHRIARYFRHILYKSDESIVTLEAELESIDEYLSLKKMILHDAFDYCIHIADDVDTIGVMVPSMILQPLAENAVKYGVDTVSRNGHITIDVEQRDDCVQISITDTGSRLSAKASQKEERQSRGIGLTQKRLELMYMRRRHAPFVEMTTLPGGGTRVLVSIPLF